MQKCVQSEQIIIPFMQPKQKCECMNITWYKNLIFDDIIIGQHSKPLFFKLKYRISFILFVNF